MKLQCITASIYQDARFGNCSNGGISTRFDEVLVPVKDGNLTIDLDEGVPENLVRIVRRNIFGREYVHVEPWGFAEKGVNNMYGGCLVNCSDSRFSETINNGGYAVSLHDRVEQWGD